ncbi:MAG: glutamate-cysteine ligase family protein [Tissierellia bacterium]|nr:glutamate-cysteine ligase family protein [Tissierellia bacterium]
MNYEDKLKRVVEYIRSGEKNPENFTLGVEMEHFVVHKDTGKTVSYYGKDGVGETLEEIEQMGFKAEREGHHVLGLHKGDITISTEPGSQFEIAITSDCCIKVLEEDYLRFMKSILQLFEKKDQSLVTLGYHPVTTIDEIKILPKKRYDFMYRYFNGQGDMAHNMMKGTASLQVTIDYKDEEDFKKKYRILNALSPVFYAVFDNAYIFENKVLKRRNIRQKIWENTDADRSGVFEIAFDDDLSYEKYADKILNTPLIFTDHKGHQEYVGGKLFKDVMTKEDGDDFIFHGLSIVFPDVRVKKYIEIRMMDSIPYPLNFACLAWIKGLFYHGKNLEDLDHMTQDISYEEVLEGKKNTAKDGLQAKFLGSTVQEISLVLLKMAQKVLGKESPYLDPLIKMVEAGETPRDRFEKIYKNQGILQAIEANAVKESEFNC